MCKKPCICLKKTNLIEVLQDGNLNGILLALDHNLTYHLHEPHSRSLLELNVRSELCDGDCHGTEYNTNQIPATGGKDESVITPVNISPEVCQAFSNTGTGCPCTGTGCPWRNLIADCAQDLEITDCTQDLEVK